MKKTNPVIAIEINVLSTLKEYNKVPVVKLNNLDAHLAILTEHKNKKNNSNNCQHNFIFFNYIL